MLTKYNKLLNKLSDEQDIKVNWRILGRLSKNGEDFNNKVEN